MRYSKSELISLRNNVFNAARAHGLKIKYKPDSILWRYLPKSFRTKVSLKGRTVWFPHRRWEEEDLVRAMCLVAHGLTHHLDKQDDGIWYTLRYGLSWRRTFRYELRAYACNIIGSLFFSEHTNLRYQEEMTNILEEWDYYVDVGAVWSDGVRMAEDMMLFCKCYLGQLRERGYITDEFKRFEVYQLYVSRGLDLFTQLLVQKERQHV